MEVTPLLAVELLSALLVLVASPLIRRLWKNFRLTQRLSHYPGALRSTMRWVVSKDLQLHYASTLRAFKANT